MIAKIVVKNKSGNKTYLIKDEKAYIVLTPEIYDAHGLPREIVSFTNELQQFLHDVGKKSIGNVVQHKFAQKYSSRVFQSVNR